MSYCTDFDWTGWYRFSHTCDGKLSHLVLKSLTAIQYWHERKATAGPIEEYVDGKWQVI